MTSMTQDFPHLPYRVPSRGTAWSQSVFKRLFLAQGWRFTGEFPNFPKAMAIVSPQWPLFLHIRQILMHGMPFSLCYSLM